MEQSGSYQSIIEKLYALYSARGFLREEEALALLTAENVSLVAVNRITNSLLEMGVFFTDDTTFSDDGYDRAVVDYESIFHEVVDISPALSTLIEYIRNTKPPQHREWHGLISQMKSGNDYAFNRLFDMYLRVAIRIAFRISKCDNIELDDAIQEGAMGLMRAIRQYDSSIHGNLGSYLPLWVQQYIDRAVADKGRTIRLPVHTLEIVRKIESNEQRLFEQLGREPHLTELASATEISEDLLSQLLDVMQETLSLEYLFESDKDFDIVDINATIPDDVAKYNILRSEVDVILGTITRREEAVIRLRFGLDNGQARTLEEIGQVFGVTRERVRHIEAKALRKATPPEENQPDKRIIGIVWSVSNLVFIWCLSTPKITYKHQK